MEKLDRKWLEDVFGTSPEIEDLENARDLIDELIAELTDENNI